MQKSIRFKVKVSFRRWLTLAANPGEQGLAPNDGARRLFAVLEREVPEEDYNVRYYLNPISKFKIVKSPESKMSRLINTKTNVSSWSLCVFPKKWIGRRVSRKQWKV